MQPYVTELDLRHSLVPDEMIEDLISSMPVHKGPDLLEDRDLPKWDYVRFMERMTLGDGDHPREVVQQGGEEEDRGRERGDVTGGRAANGVFAVERNGRSAA